MDPAISDAEQRLSESETRIRLLLGNVAQAVWETDAAGVVVTDSPSWRAYTGQSVDQWFGDEWLEAVHPDDRSYAERQWHEAMAAQSIVNAEFRVRSPAGDWRWTNVRAAPVLDPAGQIEKWLGINVDIDVRRRAENKLREREADLMRVQRIGRVGGLDIDLTAGLISVRSPEYLRLHGLGSESLYETHADWRARVHPDDAEEAEHKFFAAINGSGNSYDNTYRIIRPSDGAVRWIHARADIERDASGKATRLVGAHLDVSDQKRMEEDLRASEDRQAFLLELSDVLRATPLDVIIERAIEMLAAKLELDLSYVVTVFPGEDRAEVEHQLRLGRDMPGVPATIRLSDFPQAFVEWQERTLVSEDLAHDPKFTDLDRQNVAAMKFGALIAAPVRRGAGNPIWSIVAVMGRPRRWTANEIALVEETAERTWGAVERARSEAVVRASQERQEFLLKLSDEMRPLTSSIELERVAVEMLGEKLGASRVFYATMDQGEASWSVARDYHDGVSSIVGQYSLSEFQHARLAQWRAGRMSSVADSKTDPALNSAERKAYQLFGARAAIGIPLVRADRFDALLVVNQAEPRLWTQAEIALAQETAERTWTAIERARTEAALRTSEARQHVLIEGVPQLVWRAVDHGQWTWASRQWTELTGQAEVDSHGSGWLDQVHPADRATAMQAWDGATERGEFHVDYRVCHAQEGRYRWFQTRATPVRSDEGEIVEWLGTSTDVDDLRKLQERQDVLLAELQHRVRNILAVTRSIISRSNDGERSTEDYVAHLQGRISALARTQVLLTRSAGSDVDLETLIWDELVVQSVSEDQITVAGDPVALSPKCAEVLTLAVHELATNATKYGAFSRSSGRLDVRWQVEARGSQDWLVITWQERGVAIVDAVPRRQGFGLELITRRIPYELKGHGSLELRPGGLQSLIEFPLVEGESILQTDAGAR